VSGALRSWPQFSEKGIMEGEYNSTITPEICFALGAAAAKMGKVGVAHAKTPSAKILASAISCGVSAAGGESFVMDIDFAAGAAYLGHTLGMGITVFVYENDGAAMISFTDERGMPISRDTERKLEAIFAGSRKLVPSESTEAANHIGGGVKLYGTAAKRLSTLGQEKINMKLNVLGDNPESFTLRELLLDLGCELVDINYGVPVFELYNGGTRLRAKNEAGHEVNWEHLMCVMSLIEMEFGKGRMAVPFEAPKVIDDIAGGYGRKVLRLGREREAEPVFTGQPWLRDGIFAALRIAAGMVLADSSLVNMTDRVPNFSTVSREVVILGKRGEAMRKLSCDDGFCRDGGPGLWYSSDKGYARVKPIVDREALMVTAECTTMEAAEELCGSIRDMIERK